MRKALFLFILLLLMGFPLKSLVISQSGHSQVFILGDKWLRIQYNHSVEHSEVIEIIEANRRGMFVREMLWGDFGAGLPEDIQGLKDGYYYKKIDQPLGDSLDYWFIPFNRPEIIVDNETVIVPRTPGLVHLKIKTCPVILVLIRRC